MSGKKHLWGVKCPTRRGLLEIKQISQKTVFKKKIIIPVKKNAAKNVPKSNIYQKHICRRSKVFGSNSYCISIIQKLR